LTFPQVYEKRKSNNNIQGGPQQQWQQQRQQQEQSQRFPLTGTIEEIGKDIETIKQMSVDHIMFVFVGLDIDKVVDTTKQLSRYAR
jgi:hypothetical protein